MKYLGLTIGLIATALYAGACNGTESNQSGTSSSSPGTGQTTKKTKSRPVDPNQTCKTEPVQWAIGVAATDETVERARRESGATSVRVLPPGLAVTQEFKYGRLNLNVDESNVITSVSCW